MKTRATTAIPVNNPPLKMVPGIETTIPSPYLLPAAKHPRVLRNEKEDKEWDSPENWDEAWFANYE